MDKSRRSFLQKSSFLALAGLTAQVFPGSLVNAMNSANEAAFMTEPFALPPLPYAYDALEPFIDQMTMEVHYTKHHKAYIDNLNKAVAEGNINSSLEDLIKNASKYSLAIRNNSGGHWNHSFFWKLMKAEATSTPDGKIAGAIDEVFGSFDVFKTRFEEAALRRFGSGWAWLIIDGDKKLQLSTTPNQDNPLMDVADIKGTPILGVDVWEHAYYLKFENRRGEYLKSWWNVVNWSEVNKNFDLAME